MARARNIKPGLYKNEDLAECSIWARYLFPGLWTLADREGRLEDRPKRIKGELLPYDSQDVDPLLTELQGRGFLVRYQNSDGRFIQITKFLKHQSPHYSEKNSVIKPQILPDAVAHDETQTPGTFPEHPKKTPPIKRGSQPPDSLIPDCPNPSSSNPDSPNPECGKEHIARRRAPPDGVKILTDLGVDPQKAKDWIAVRKAKRAPLTETVIEDLKTEAKKAGISVADAVAICATRSWQGFRASWDWKGNGRDRGNEDAVAEAKRKLFGEERDITHESKRI